jgi:hypothetical protein
MCRLCNGEYVRRGQVEPDIDRPRTIAGVLAVFDVDGVVADVRHRLRHLARQPKDWAGFFAAAERDPPLPVGVDLARAWAAGHDLVWLTGRPEHLRRVTTRWLTRHDLPADRLLMRPVGDRRAASLFKAERLARLRRVGWPDPGGSAGPLEIAVVVDDDVEVVALLKARGWPVYHADWMPVGGRVLDRAQEQDGRT